MAINSQQLAASLAQVLENFQRCGLTRFGSQPAGELPAELLSHLADLNQSPAPPLTATGKAVDSGATAPPPTTAHAHQKLTTAASSSPLPATPVAGLAGGKLGGAVWGLPVLENSDRQQRLEALSAQVRDCRRCAAIVGFRQQTVFGDGPLRPTVCFMGEAPGADEDRTGTPFVGKAGQLLTKIIAAMKLRREDVYILNALKCRPPQNRTPVSDEIDNCRPFVEEQLDVLQPQFIVCLGAVAVRSLLRSELSIGSLRGQFHQYRGARVVVTYHPAYLLRNESAKKMVWEDMKMLMAELPAG